MTFKNNMFIHLSKDESVYSKSVVGIFNMDSATRQVSTRKFLRQMQRNMRTVSLTKNIPNSFVLCDDENAETVYITSLSAEALSKRGKNNLRVKK